ncbi:MAG: tetraacyldisaccharide 4'-kinase [Syntrophotaleaceae bacterium]
MNRLEGFYRRMAVRGPKSALEWALFLPLVPCGVLYGGLVRLRNALYLRGIRARERAAVPVVSVGNLTVGGTGKTPMVDWLIRYFLANDHRVAVISRGYGGKRRTGVQVVCSGQGPVLSAEDCGDEPFLLARRNPRALVLVSPRRKEAVRTAVDTLGAQVILLDDGFQHLAVARDFDIVLLDARRPFGNGHVLPAGLLREPKTGLARGHLFVLTRCPEHLFPSLPVAGTVVRCRHRLEQEAQRIDGGTETLASLAGRKGVAFAGIAEPEGFFRSLREAGLNLAGEIAFGDHCSYGPGELNRLQAACVGADFLVTTEKDGVKLTASQLPLPCFQVPMALEFYEEGVLQSLLRPLLAKEKPL